MRRYPYILSSLLFVVLLGCIEQQTILEEATEQQTSSIVERTEDGKLRVSAAFSVKDMSSIATNTRATQSPDMNINEGWCVIFGVDETLYDTEMVDGVMKVYEKGTKKEISTDRGYGRNSKLLQKTKVIANMNGRFNMTFEETEERVFMRFILNLCDREDDVTEYNIVSQAEADANTNDNITDDDVTTFDRFLNASVGLDGLFNMTYNTDATVDADGNMVYDPINTTSPDPNEVQPELPMSSHGYVLDKGISEETISDIFDTTIELIRMFSKIEVFSANSSTETANGKTFDSKFEIEEVTLLKGANEVRYRSALLSSTGSTIETFATPKDLGGAVQYLPVSAASATQSKPIYLYPNSCGMLLEADNSVNKNIEPTFIIIKGKANGYDNYGYYKIALKAQYPLQGKESENHEKSETDYWSPVTYDIWRNAHFSVCLLEVDKPGYATFDDAADPNTPSSNISYNIVIDGTDNRHEYLVSNGTYFVELETSRVYAKGYLGDYVSGTIDFTIKTAKSTYYHPDIYIYDENGAEISGVTVNGAALTATKELNGISTLYIPSSLQATQEVSINFKANKSGNLYIRCGDILKRIPVLYEAMPVKIAGESKLTITDVIDKKTVSWSDFGYAKEGDIEVISQTGSRIIDTNGKATSNAGIYINRELKARIFSASGVMLLCVRQASDFCLWDNVTTEKVTTDSINIIYQSTGNIYTYNGTDVSNESGNDNRDYEVRGEVTQTGNSGWVANKTSYDFGYANTAKGFSITPAKIEDNKKGTYGASDIGTSHLKGEKTITLTNIAGESHTYTITISQYALPVVQDMGTNGKFSGDVYYWYDPKLTADLYDTDWNAFTDYHNRNKEIGDITIYNCKYNNGDYPTGDWAWEAMKTSSVGYNSKYNVGGNPLDERTSSSSAIAWCKYGATVGGTTSGNNTWKFTVKVQGHKNNHSSKYSSYFTITVTNYANEEFKLKIMLRFDRSFIS